MNAGLIDLAVGRPSMLRARAPEDPKLCKDRVVRRERVQTKRVLDQQAPSRTFSENAREATGILAQNVCTMARLFDILSR